MRSIPFLLLLFAASAAAQYAYIVPVAGQGSGVNGMFFGSSLWVINRGAKTATVRVKDVYTAAGGAGCFWVPLPVTIESGRSSEINPICGKVFSYVVDSDQPLAANATIAVTFNTGSNAWCEETVDVPTRWSPAGSEVVIANVRFMREESRASLIVVNPNDSPLHIKVRLIRPEFGNTVADHDYVAAPRSVLMQPLVPVDGAPGSGQSDPIVVSGRHDLIVSADGPFVAGATSVTPYLSLASYRRAEPMER